jgi:hypothetical protein
MSTIKRFFDKTVVVSRLRLTEGRKRAFSATATVDGHIQSLDYEGRQILGILNEKGWRAWFDVEADVKENDRITDSEGVVYNVREVIKKDYGINQHLEAVLMEQSE